MLRKQTRKDFFNTLSFKLIAGIFAVVIPMLVLLIYNNYQSRSSLQHQIENVHENMLRAYLNQADTQLTGAMSYNITMAFHDNDSQIAAFSGDEALSQYAQIRMKKSLNDKLYSANLIDGFFIILKSDSGKNTEMFVPAQTPDRQISGHIREYLEAADTQTNTNPYTGKVGWQEYSIDGVDYIINLAAYNDNILAGSYVDLAHLAEKLGGAEDGIGCYPLSAGIEADKNMRLVTVASKTAPFVIAEEVEENRFYASMPFMQRNLPWVTALLLLTIPLIILYVNLIAAAPLRRLTGAMRTIQSGDMDYRIPSRPAPSEVKIVNETFNGMISQLQQLKIAIYEEELKSQRAQLRNLQLQVRPHFLINSLNMVYNAIGSGDSALAKTLILHSVDYFRYMVKVDEDLVALYEEIDHVRSYLDIQTLRYPGSLSYSIDVDPMVNDMLIPPLIIQSIVENSMKYAIDPGETLEIKIDVQSYEIDYQPYACIRVSDTGRGFPEKMLEAINSGRRQGSDKGRRIGIQNVIRRIEILFKGQNSRRFYNDGGAVAQFDLPAFFPEESPPSEEEP